MTMSFRFLQLLFWKGEKIAYKFVYNGEEYLHDVFPSGSAYGAGLKKKNCL